MAPRVVELARRVARFDDPEEGLAAVAALRAHLDALEARHVEAAIRTGLSWSRIARLLAVSRQAVHKKYSRPRRSRPTTTEQAREAVRMAGQEAGSMGHRSVGPEHLLLGLLREDRGAAVEALDVHGVSFAAARREVRRLYGQGGGADGRRAAGTEPVPVSTRARAVLEDAVEEARRRGDVRLGVEHVLAALLHDSDGGAVRALAALGVTPGEVEEELARTAGWTGDGAGRRPASVPTSEGSVS